MVDSKPSPKMSAFQLFVKVTKENNPDDSISDNDFNKKCTEKWNALTDKEKEKYRTMEKRDKERFEKEMKALKDAGSEDEDKDSDEEEEDSEEDTKNNRKKVVKRGDTRKAATRKIDNSKSKRKNKDPTRPKRAPTAFFIFSAEMRPTLKEKHPDWKITDMAKELGRMWQSLGDKSKYEHMAKEAAEKRDEELKTTGEPNKKRGKANGDA